MGRRGVLAVIAISAVGLAPQGAAAQVSGNTITDGNARFQVLSPTLIRLEYAGEGRFEDRPTQVATNRRPRAVFRTSVAKGVREIRTSRMTLRYRLGSGPFAGGNLKATVRIGKRAVRVKPTFPPPPGPPPQPPNPPSRTQAPPNPDPDPAPRTKGNLGGWARGLDDQEQPVPLADGLISRDGWYVLDESRSPVLTGEQPGFEPRRSQNGGYQDGYLFGYGSRYALGLRDLRALSGAAPLLPRRAFGNWFSRWWPYGAAELEAIADRFRSERVPLDVLGLDTDFKAPVARFAAAANGVLGRDASFPYSWNGWDWNRNLFPDPQGFIDRLHARGIATYLNVHPSIGDRDPRWAEAQERAGGLISASPSCMYFEADFAPCAVFDWTNDRHLDAYWALHEPFERLGIDFWWLDWCCDESRARAPGLTEDTWINSLYARRSRARGSRWPAFSRIGSSYWAYFGEHEPGAFAEHRQTIHFTGDTAATWEMLDFQSRFTVAEGNLGLPYVSHDIGSFKGKHLNDEMYVRWLQAGAFGPLNRLHSNHGDRLPWEYSGAAAQIGADFLRLRGSLVPFLYTLAREAHDSGLPMARGMYLRWPAHEDAYRLDRQYMLGDSLLVAPVGEPGDPATKEVWFPPGEWADFFTGERIRGPRVVELSVPLARMPVFARAGAVVPTQPYRYNEAAGAPDPLVLTAWSGADGSFRLYEDAGDGREYRRGARSFTRIVHDDRGPARSVVTIGAARGDYAGKPGRRRWRLRLVGAGRPAAVRVNGRRVSRWTWDGQTHALTLTTPRLSTARGVRIDVRR